MSQVLTMHLHFAGLFLHSPLCLVLDLEIAAQISDLISGLYKPGADFTAFSPRFERQLTNPLPVLKADFAGIPSKQCLQTPICTCALLFYYYFAVARRFTNPECQYLMSWYGDSVIKYLSCAFTNSNTNSI